MTKVIETTFTVWAVGTGVTAFVGVVIGFIQVITGNVISF